MIVLLAVTSAFVFGAAVVVQQRAAMEVPETHAARPGLLVRLFRRPLWLVGLCADVAGFALQAIALRRGSLVVVQPLITTSLLFTLVLTSAWYHEAISAAEWFAVLCVLVGLSVFLVVARPAEHSLDLANTQGWLLTTAAIATVTLVTMISGLVTSGRLRAAAFGVAAGAADAYMAVLAKAFAETWDRGLVAVLRSWTPYALVAGGLIALLLVSTAYQAGFPTVSLPIITVTDPLIGSLIGIALFGEQLALGGVRGPIVAAGLAAVVFGLLSLGRDTRLANVMVEQAHNAMAEHS